MAYDKKKMACPYCGTEMSINGLTQHCRFKHPDKYDDWTKNKESYINKLTVKEDEPEVEVPEIVEPEEPATVDVEVENAKADTFLEDEEPEYFKIKQIKSDKPKSESKPKRKQRKSTTKQEPKPETKRRRYGFFNRRN